MSKIYKALARAEAERGGTQNQSLRPSHILEPESHEPLHLSLPERADEYEKLKVMLTLEATRSDFRSVMFVSTLEREGVSTVTLGLAASMAEGSRQGVLVIDLNSATDLAHRLGLAPRTGLGEVLENAVPWHDAVVESQVPRLFLLGEGKTTPDFSQPNALARFEELVKGARSSYDFVILDGGSLEASPDGLLVAGRVDGVILVVQSERTGQEAIREASAKLKRAGANLLGVVLNRHREYLPNFLSKKF